MSGPVLLLDIMDTVVRDPFWDMPGFFGYAFDDLWPQAHPTAWVDFELALIDEATFLRSFFADGRSFDVDGFLALVRRGFRWIEGMEELLAELRAAGVEMHALSNYPRWWRTIEEELALSRYLRWSFVSCETGLRKPAPAAYTSAAEALGRQTGECVFVDNTGRNCKAAMRVGMGAIKFVGATELRRSLCDLGLLAG